jgi:hypothetical protein
VRKKTSNAFVFNIRRLNFVTFATEKVPFDGPTVPAQTLQRIVSDSCPVFPVLDGAEQLNVQRDNAQLLPCKGSEKNPRPNPEN